MMESNNLNIEKLMQDERTKGAQLRFYSVSVILPTLVLLLITFGWIYSGDHFSNIALWGAHHEAFLYLNQASQIFPIEIIQLATLLGDTSVALLILAPLMWHRPGAWLAIVFSIPVGAVASVLMKYLTAVPRPAAIIDESSFILAGQALIGHNSFPSGHCITIFAAAAAILTTKSIRSRQFLQWGLFSFVILVSLFVCYSRIAIGAHWPIDVVAGAAIGWVSGLSGVLLLRRWMKQEVAMLFVRTKAIFVFVIGVCVTLIVMKWSVVLHEQVLLTMAIVCGGTCLGKMLATRKSLVL